MNKAAIRQLWDSLRTVHGITLRAIAALPEDSLDSHPIPGMRTPKELVVHLYGMVRDFPTGVRDGALKDHDEARSLAENRSRADLLAWCRVQWDTADAIVSQIDDAALAAPVSNPWTDPFPGFVAFQILSNEVWHHRGQLYCYLRALGTEGPMIYDYEHNEPEFQPRAPAKA